MEGSYFLQILATLLSAVSVANYVSALTPDEIASFAARSYIDPDVGIQARVTIANSSNSGILVITSNGIPDHESGPFAEPEGVEIIEQDFEYYLPRNPTTATTPTDLNMGAVGISINGVALFSAYNREGQDAVIEEEPSFDDCDGHPTPEHGTYHYHSNPFCLFEDEVGVASPIVGVALDGFPIYGPNDENGNRLYSADLDECHGRYVNGNYRYHVTEDFPYIIACYKGEVDPRNVPGGERPERPDSGGTGASAKLSAQFAATVLLVIASMTFVSVF